MLTHSVRSSRRLTFLFTLSLIKYFKADCGEGQDTHDKDISQFKVTKIVLSPYRLQPECGPFFVKFQSVPAQRKCVLSSHEIIVWLNCAVNCLRIENSIVTGTSHEKKAY